LLEKTVLVSDASPNERGCLLPLSKTAVTPRAQNVEVLVDYVLELNEKNDTDMGERKTPGYAPPLIQKMFSNSKERSFYQIDQYPPQFEIYRARWRKRIPYFAFGRHGQEPIGWLYFGCHPI